MDQQRQRADAGVGLVEVIVGMLIASLATAALAQALVVSVKVQRSDRQQAVGHALAVAELEVMQGLPWSLVGHYGDDADLPSGAVVLGPARPTGSRAPRPVDAVVRRDVTDYRVERTVRFYNDPATSSPTDYKQLTVRVTWTAGQGPRSTRVDSIRTPKVGELAPSDFALRRGTATPADVALDGSGALQAALTLALELTSPGSSASASWTDRAGSVRTQALGSSDGGRTYTATLPAGTCCFRSAEVPFVLTASRTTPAGSVSGTAAAALLQPLAVDSVVVGACSAGTRPVTVTTTGTQSTDSVVLTAADGSTWTTTAATQTASGGTWTATVAAPAVQTTLSATATRARPTTTSATGGGTALAPC